MTLPLLRSRNFFALMMLFGCISFPHMAAAFDVCVDGERIVDENGDPTIDSSCVHEDMADYGVRVHFNNHDAEEYADLLQHGVDVRYGAGHEDEIDHIYGETGSSVTVGHFWDPDPDGVFNPLKQNTLDGAGFFLGELPNGWQKSQAYWSRALGEYAAGNLTDEFLEVSGNRFITNAGAYHFLGHVVHHMGDNTIPTHVSVISHAPLNRDSYENWMSNKYHLICTRALRLTGVCAFGDLDYRLEYSPQTYNHRLTELEESALNFNYQPKLGRIDPLAYVDLNFDIPEVPGVETPDDKLLWLLYTTNQIAEFFAADRNNVGQSDGEGEANDPTGWAQADLNRMASANPSLRPQTVDQISDDDSCDCDAPPEQDLSSIREYSYLRGIRAIGGLANLFQQTVTTRPILSIDITAVDVMLPNGTCKDGAIGDTCDFYSKVAFSDVTATPLSAFFPVVVGQNDGDQQEDNDNITPTNWKWGHSVETEGFVRIRLQIYDDDDPPVQNDVPVRIAPQFSDEDFGGKALLLEVDLAKCLSGEAGAIVAKDAFLGGALSGQISSSVCGQRITTSVTGNETEDDGIARVAFTIKMNESSPPVISCDEPDGLWHADDVSIACTATDESGLANPNDASFLLSTNEAGGTETSNALTNSREICDRNGNCATAGPIAGNKIDKKVPEILIASPTATQYLSSASLVLDYDVTDGGSGIASVTGTIDGDPLLAGQTLDSGQVINLLTELSLGEHTFAVDAVDNVDNQSPTASVTFEIVVTPQAIIDALKQLNESDDIARNMLNPLLAKLQNAQRKYDAGECTPASNMYGAFINQLQAQTEKKVSTMAAEILTANAEYLIANCGVEDASDETTEEPASGGASASGNTGGSESTGQGSTSTASAANESSSGGGSMGVPMCLGLLLVTVVAKRRRRRFVRIG